MEYQADPDVQGQPHEVDIREWEEGTVNALLRSLGFPYYEQQIKGPLQSSRLFVFC